MSICNTNTFSLEDIHIVGGDYKEFPIHVRDNDRGGLMDVANLQMNFSLVLYQARYGSPIIAKNLAVSTDDPTAFLLVLYPEETKDLSGQYMYQLSVKAPNDKQESFQGFLYVGKNLNPGAFTTSS